MRRRRQVSAQNKLRRRQVLDQMLAGTAQHVLLEDLAELLDRVTLQEGVTRFLVHLIALFQVSLNSFWKRHSLAAQEK